MARKMKRFADGGASNARYDRKIADIEKDFAKAKASGKNADVAKAKYEQRMADAKDDLAKWTGADRTATRAGEKAAEETLSIARKTKGANIANRDRPSTMLDRPAMALPDITVPKVADGDRAVTKQRVARRTGPVATAPRAAAAPAKTKTPIVTVDAGTSEAPSASRTPAAQARAASYRAAFQSGRAGAAATAPNTTTTTAKTPARDVKAVGNITAAATTAAASRGQRPATFAPVNEARRKQIEEAAARRAASTNRNPYVYAKGGSVDGCAIRGKTRAKLRKN